MRLQAARLAKSSCHTSGQSEYGRCCTLVHCHLWTCFQHSRCLAAAEVVAARGESERFTVACTTVLLFAATSGCGKARHDVLLAGCRVGVDNVVASDVRTSRKLLDSGPFSYCDVLDKVGHAQCNKIAEDVLCQKTQQMQHLHGYNHPARRGRFGFEVPDCKMGTGCSRYGSRSLDVGCACKPQH
jgi:hypothetical protein